MADQLFLSYRLRGFTENNMLRHYEKMLRQFPFSRLNPGGVVLRVSAVSWEEPPLIELPLPDPLDIDQAAWRRVQKRRITREKETQT